jgi:hypothetical protein
MNKLRDFFSTALSWLKNQKRNILFFFGLCLSPFELDLFEMTFVPGQLLLLLWVLGGLAAMPFTKRFLAGYKYTPNLFYRIIYHVGAFGSILTFLVLGINKIVLITKGETYKVKIESVFYYKHNGRNTPKATVIMSGMQRNLAFDDNVAIEDYSYVDVTLRRGLFGMEVIDSHRVAEDTHTIEQHKKP